MQMSVGDLVQCVGKKIGEPEIGEIGIIIKSEKGIVVACVTHRGKGRIWTEDWQIISKGYLLKEQIKL